MMKTEQRSRKGGGREKARGATLLYGQCGGLQQKYAETAGLESNFLGGRASPPDYVSKMS